MRFIRNILIICCICLLNASVFASPPDRGTWSGSFDIPIFCDGYELTLVLGTNTRYTFFYDKDGLLIADQFQNDGEVEIFRNDDAENILSGHRREIQRNHRDGTASITGGFVKVTVPGHGNMFFDVGRIEIDDSGNFTYFHGNNHDFFLNEVDALCEYFE